MIIQKLLKNPLHTRLLVTYILDIIYTTLRQCNRNTFIIIKSYKLLCSVEYAKLENYILFFDNCFCKIVQFKCYHWRQDTLVDLRSIRNVISLSHVVGDAPNKLLFYF